MKTYNGIRRVFSTTVLLALSVIAAQAHPGHGFSESSPTHLLTSPDHLLVLALSGSLLALGARLIERTLPRRILQVTGVLALTTAAIIWGSHLI